MTSGEMTMCGGPLRDKVMKWMAEDEAEGAIVMTAEAAFPGLCLGYLIQGGM